MKKDILFMCQYFYPEHNSSATLPFDTAKALVKKGFSVDVLCGYPKEYTAEKEIRTEEQVDGLNIKRVRYMQFNRKWKIGRLINYFSFTASIFLKLLDLKKYNCIIVYSNPPILPVIAAFAKKMFGTKFIFVCYDVYPEIAIASDVLKQGCLIDHLMRLINHVVFKQADRIVALTDEMKTFLLEHRPELTSDRVVTIANWAHEECVSPEPEMYGRFGYNPGQFIVSYFGNMGICQEMDTLVSVVEYLRSCKNIRFLFVGHGNKKESIEAYFKERRLENVQVLDFLIDEEFEQALAISSCCVVSLEKGLKGLCAPSKYYSYLQTGKPVIAIVEKASYLAKEVADNDIGWVITHGDIQGAAAVIQKAVDHIDGLKDICQRAKQLYSDEFCKDKGTDKYADVIRELVEQ